MKAYAWSNGRIDFGQRVPKGALVVCIGKAKKVRHVITATARLAYDGVTLLVPGVPEAENEDAALDALIAYCNWIEPRFEKEPSCKPQ